MNTNKFTFYLFVLAAVFVAGCSSDDCAISASGNGLVSPDIKGRIAGATQSPMTGVLEVYPCNAGTSIYFGNYYNGSLTPFNGFYFLENGNVFGTSSRPILLPVGTYNMIYWGTPKYEEPIYANPVIKDPALTLGGDLSLQYFGLRQYLNDTLYYPVFDLVQAVKPVAVGSEEMSASMSRKVAGVKVIVKNKNNGILSSSIGSMSVRIGSIAETLNFYTGEPANQTKTVAFPLVLSTDGTQMSNATVMVFPSAQNPLLQLLITLRNGTQKVYRQNLSTPLLANTKLILTLTLGDVFSEENTGAFTIDNWVEQVVNIDIPILSDL